MNIICNTFLAADTRFFDPRMIKKTNLTATEYNQMIIEKINTIVSKDDFLLLFGEISYGKVEETKSLITQIQSKCIVTDLNNQPIIKRDDLWKSIGIIKTCSLDGFIEGIIDNKEEKVIINMNKDNTKIWYNENYYFAAAESSLVKEKILKKGEIFNKKVLNLSIYNWCYEPIEMNEIPRIIDDQLFFNSMKGEQ